VNRAQRRKASRRGGPFGEPWDQPGWHGPPPELVCVHCDEVVNPATAMKVVRELSPAEMDRLGLTADDAEPWEVVGYVHLWPCWQHVQIALL